VLGAGGTIAPAIVHDLAASTAEVAGMLLLDLDGARAQRVAERHGGADAVARRVDARATGALAQQLNEVDVLVNTASYRVNLDAMQACLAAGCHYLDLGGLYWMTSRQLQLGDELERAGLLALLGIGSSPGKTNLMALKAVRALGDEVEIDTIEVAAAGRDPLAAGDDGRLHPPYALQTLLDELTLAPVVIERGEPVEIEPLTDGGELDFGEPVGRAQTIYPLHSELATFPESFGCAAASFRLSLAPALLAGLEQLTGASAQAVADAARDAVAPSPETVSVHLVRVTARDGAAVTVRAVTRPHFGLGGSVVSTAAPAAAAVRLLARGELSATGARPPERCIDPDAMFAELEARGCSFTISA
jgi:saccharopine dehydrogenase (NAD+, L-lysine-forming)